MSTMTRSHLTLPQTSNLGLEEIDKIFLPADRQDFAERTPSVLRDADDDSSGKGHASEKVEKV